MLILLIISEQYIRKERLGLKEYFPSRTDPNGFAEFDYIPLFFGSNQKTFFAIDISECLYFTLVSFWIGNIPCHLDGLGDFPVFNPYEIALACPFHKMEASNRSNLPTQVEKEGVFKQNAQIHVGGR